MLQSSYSCQPVEEKESTIGPIFTTIYELQVCKFKTQSKVNFAVSYFLWRFPEFTYRCIMKSHWTYINAHLATSSDQACMVSNLFLDKESTDGCLEYEL